MPQPEIPVALQDWGWIEDPTRPETPLQALMETAPNNEPVEDRWSLQQFREVVADCMTALTAEQRFIINAYDMERLSYAQLGRRLGVHKSHAARLHKTAQERLGRLMRAQPLIQERNPLLAPTTWNQAAADAVAYIETRAFNELPVPFAESLLRVRPWYAPLDPLVDMGATALGWLQNLDDTNADDIVTVLVDRHTRNRHRDLVGVNKIWLATRARMIRKASRAAAADNAVMLVAAAATAVMFDRNTYTLPLEETP